MDQLYKFGKYGYFVTKHAGFGSGMEMICVKCLKACFKDIAKEAMPL